jgi:hypothetical protein
MPNHVHLILNPKRSDGLGDAWEKRAAAIPTSSTLAVGGRATCFRAGSFGGHGQFIVAHGFGRIFRMVVKNPIGYLCGVRGATKLRAEIT